MRPRLHPSDITEKTNKLQNYKWNLENWSAVHIHLPLMHLGLLPSYQELPKKNQEVIKADLVSKESSQSKITASKQALNMLRSQINTNSLQTKPQQTALKQEILIWKASSLLLKKYLPAKL